MFGRGLRALTFFSLILTAVRFNAIPANDARLADAVMNRDQSAIRALLRDKVDVNGTQADGMTALHWAVREDNLETAQLLIRTGARVSVATRYGVTPIYLACANGNANDIRRGVFLALQPPARKPSTITLLEKLTGRECGKKARSPWPSSCVRVF